MSIYRLCVKYSYVYTVQYCVARAGDPAKSGPRQERQVRAERLLRSLPLSALAFWQMGCVACRLSRANWHSISFTCLPVYTAQDIHLVRFESRRVVSSCCYSWLLMCR